MTKLLCVFEKFVSENLNNSTKFKYSSIYYFYAHTTVKRTY